MFRMGKVLKMERILNRDTKCLIGELGDGVLMPHSFLHQGLLELKNAVLSCDGKVDMHAEFSDMDQTFNDVAEFIRAQLKINVEPYKAKYDVIMVGVYANDSVPRGGYLERSVIGRRADAIRQGMEKGGRPKIKHGK